jgi:hypothetical protein
MNEYQEQQHNEIYRPAITRLHKNVNKEKCTHDRAFAGPVEKRI